MPPRPLAVAVAACAALVVLGCGDGVPQPDQPLAGGSLLDEFRGTWRFDSATASLNCPGNPASMGTPSGNIVLVPGTSAPLVAVSPFGIDASAYCNFEFDIDGFNARMRDGQSCLLPTVGWTFSPDASWRFTVVGAGQAEESGVATVGTTAGDCGYVEMATLTRIAHN